MKYEESTLKMKKSLADSLKKLACQKPFSKVTVKDIITDCGVNRKTFYYHFEDIYDLLKWLFAQEAIEIIRQFDLLSESREAFLFVLDYVSENERFLYNICHSLGRMELKKFFYNDFIGIMRSCIDEAEQAQDLCVAEDFKSFLSEFYAEAIAGVLLLRIDDPQKQDKQQLVQYLSLLINETIPNALTSAARSGLKESRNPDTPE